MDQLLRVAMAAANLGALRDAIRAWSRQLAILVVGAALGLFFALAAVLWLDVALWFYCLPRLGPPIASLIAAGALLLVALAALCAVLLMRAPRAAALPTGPNPAAAGDALREATALMRRHLGTILAIAAVAGVVIGSTPQQRR
jgi:hypothetical protein